MESSVSPRSSELVKKAGEDAFAIYSVENVGADCMYRKLRDFSSGEYALYLSDEARLNCYHECDLLLSGIKVNINSFNTIAMSAVADYRFRKTSSDEVRTRLDIAIAGALFNFLNSVRAFIDQTESSLRREYGGESSPEFKAWKVETGKAFDVGLPYGFIDKLRNYCQHVGIPAFVHSAVYNSEADQAIYKVEFDRDDLLSKYDGWGKVAEKLKVQPQFFSVFQVMSDWAGSFNEVSKYIHKFWHAYAVEAACRIRAYRREFQVTGDLIVASKVEAPKPGELHRIPRFVPEAKARKVVIAYATPIPED